MVPFQGLVYCTEDPAFPEYVGLGMAAANTKCQHSSVINTGIDIYKHVRTILAMDGVFSVIAAVSSFGPNSLQHSLRRGSTRGRTSS